MNVRKLDHIAIAVTSIEEAARLFIDVLGGAFVAGGDDDERGIRTMQIALGGFKIELMEPTREDSYLQRFVEKHGQGFHHLTLLVDDVVDAVAHLEEHGFETVDTDVSRPEWKETYVRPRSAFGTLLQLAETDHSWDVSYPGVTREAVAAGKAVTAGRGFAPRGEVA